MKHIGERMKKLLAMVMAVMVLCSCTSAVATDMQVDATSGAASTTGFSDVASTHWAYDAITTLVEGGLVNGYGDGTFAPNDTLSIDQLATIICRAKGFNTGTLDGYWAYYAVAYCITIGCLPNLGDITAEVYSVPCTREMALYMITEGLGATGQLEINYALVATDIPDYEDISEDYRDTILQAYKWGLTTGVDAVGTFDPDGEVTRAALCAMLYRAGFTTARETPDDTVATGLTGAEIYDIVASWGWEKDALNHLVAQDPLLGGMRLSLSAGGLISIQMKETNFYGFTTNGVSADRYGTPTSELDLQSGDINQDGVYVRSSAWSYEARQKVKEILQMAYPTGYEEAYQAILSVMLQEVYEVPSKNLASAVRWIDGRDFEVYLDQTLHGVYVYIAPKNNATYYYEVLASPSTGSNKTYYTDNGHYTEVATTYEFYKG